jgi:hypothetical protein
MKIRTFTSYRHHPAVTPEAEFSALVGVYRLALDAHAKKEAVLARQPGDAKGSMSDSRRTQYTG